MLERLGVWSALVGIRWWLVLASLQVGDVDEAGHWLEQTAPPQADDPIGTLTYGLGVRAEILLARGEVEAGLRLWRRAVDLLVHAEGPIFGVDTDPGEDQWTLEAEAVTVVAHAQHGRLDLVEALTGELPHRLSTMLANPVANPPPYLMELPTCGGLLLALATVDLDRGGRTGDQRATRSGARMVALDAAEVAVAVVRARLATATAELASARRRRADALVALAVAADEVGRQEARLAWQIRRAYMTGGVSGLSVVVQANDLRDLMERAVTLGYVIRADQDVLGRLELARRRSVRLHQAMVEAEQDRTAAEAKVRRQLAELEQVRAVRQDAKHQLDARVARLAGAAAALRRRSAELRRLIHQEELARQRAAQAGARGVGRGVGPAL